jgi:uncharacterized damage-inducible protein DinB
MNDGLTDGFRHHIWATRQVMALCRGLTDDQLRSNATGTFGSMIDTFWHLISSDASYYARLAGEDPAWDRRADDAPSLDQMAGYLDDLDARWNRFLEIPFDAERTFAINWEDGSVRDVPAGVVLMQALHHGTEHRAHICTILSSLGIEIPDLGLWDWAEATNRAKLRDA